MKCHAKIYDGNSPNMILVNLLPGPFFEAILIKPFNVFANALGNKPVAISPP